MNLGDLEFKPSDFYGIVAKRDDAAGVIPEVAKRANKLLRERLERAHKVYGIKDPLELLMVFCAQPREHDTHTARLVCIEELPK